jgi:hypothetical protein
LEGDLINTPKNARIKTERVIMEIVILLVIGLVITLLMAGAK